MKQLKINLGDTLVIQKPSKISNGMVIQYDSSTWDVIKITKKFIHLQNYPTYEMKKIKK